MTWQEAKVIARGHIEKIGVPAALGGVKCLLADYADEDTLRFLKADDSAITLPGQRMINQAFARELRKRGGVVELVPVDIADYFAWLGKFQLANTPANRAQFISWLTAPEPKPTPLHDAPG